MLDADPVSSPRPPPPAKARRSTPTRQPSSSLFRSANDSSPPPYAPPLVKPEYLSDPTQSDLNVLLQRADSIFREREQDFAYSSDTVRALSEAGSALQQRNNSLIAHLPPSRPGSPVPTPFSPSLVSGRLTPSLGLSHSRSSSRNISQAFWNPPSPVQTHHHRRRHSRHISSTPAELAALADQNAALLDRLRDLEADAARADNTSQRRLRELEREIHGLKGELEQTRVVSERLEGALQAGDQSTSTGPPPDLDAELAKMWKRLDREAKVRELKAKVRPWDNSGDVSDGPRDYAPGSSHFLPKPDQTSTPIKQPQLEVVTALDGSMSPTRTQTPRERSIVAQLLLKINELEETNAQFAAEHAEAKLRLHHAELETENVRRLCDFISEEMLNIAGIEEADIELDGDPAPLESSNSPQKARRVRRKASLQIEALRQQQSEEGEQSRRGLRRFSSIESFSSSHILPAGRSAADLSQPTRPRRRRGPILHLYDEDNASQSLLFPSSSCESYNSSILSEEAKEEPQPEPSFLGTNEAMDGNLTTGEDDSTRMKSLSSELGLQVNLNMGSGGSGSPTMASSPLLSPTLPSSSSMSMLGHVRSRSIMELLYAAEGTPGEKEPSGSGCASPTLVVPALLPVHPSQSSSSAESISLDTPTMPTIKCKQSTSLSGNTKTTFSAGISSPGSLSSLSPSASSFSNLNSPPSSAGSPEAEASEEPKAQVDDEKDAEEIIPVTTRDNTSSNEKWSFYTSMLVELWLWMQFTVILAVFVVTMARMGPKSVIRGPGRQIQRGPGGGSGRAL